MSHACPSMLVIFVGCSLCLVTGPVVAVDIIPFSSNWQYLHPLDGVDPAITDADFNSTWNADATGFASYDGPAFNQGSGLLGYGHLNLLSLLGEALGTDVGTPPSGSRFTAFFRHEFHLDSPTSDVGIELFSDDGAVVYLDGVEVARNNFAAGQTDTYQALTGQPWFEGSRSRHGLPDLTEGDHVVAVSIHQNDTLSSDLGFDLRLFENTTPFYGDIVPNHVSGFAEPAEGAFTYLPSTVPFSEEIGFDSTGNVTGGNCIGGSCIGVQDFADDQAFVLHNVKDGVFRTDFVDISRHSEVTVGMDIRAWNTDLFGADDSLRVVVEASEDSLHFTQIPVPGLNGILGASLDALDLGGQFGPFTTFDVNIPDAINTLRIFIEAENNSDTEWFIFDNIRITGLVLGDMDCDGDVDFDDILPFVLAISDDITGFVTLISESTQSVPEPNALGLAAMAMLGVIGFACHKSAKGRTRNPAP